MTATDDAEAHLRLLYLGGCPVSCGVRERLAAPRAAGSRRQSVAIAGYGITRVRDLHVERHRPLAGPDNGLSSREDHLEDDYCGPSRATAAGPWAPVGAPRTAMRELL